MATWEQIIAEIQKSATDAGGTPQIDAIRRRHLIALQQHTKRETIVYAANFTYPVDGHVAGFTSLSLEDIHGLMSVIHGLKGKDLDLVIHSPGGLVMVAEAFVSYIRAKFKNVRVIVPNMAMSAATMIACAANRIVMSRHSFIGPIDPQFIIGSESGLRMVPAQDVIDQFEMAQKDCADPARLAAWLPILPQYGPAFLVQCKNELDLAKTLVGEWLQKYMFEGMSNAQEKAAAIANWLGDHRTMKSHSRMLNKDVCVAKGLEIDTLEDDPVLQDLVLSVFHSVIATFLIAPHCGKFLENHLGVGFFRLFQPPAKATASPPAQPQTGSTK